MKNGPSSMCRRRYPATMKPNGPAIEAGEEQPELVAALVVAEDVNRLDAEDDPLRDEVEHAGGDHHRPEERIAHEEFQAREDTLLLGRGLDASAGPHDRGDDQEG